MSIRRVVCAVGLAVAVSGAVTAINPAPASADTAIQVVQIPCPDWVGSEVGAYSQIEALVAADQTFYVSDSRVVVNDLDSPVTATFTSQVSNTFSISVTTGVTVGQLWSFLTVNVSSTITMSTTAQLGVSTTATVPAHSIVIGDYGVEAFNVTYRAYVVFRRSIGGCWVHLQTMGHEEAFTPAPTYIQGWRLREG
jgi:hypothetical protein